MATDHLTTIRDLLVAGGHPSTIYASPVISNDDVPDRAIFMVPTGDEQDPSKTFHDTEVEQRKTVQIRIRGPQNQPQVAYDDARAALDLVKNESPAGYLSLHYKNGPNYLQTDDDGRHEYSINVLCWLIE